MKTVAVVPAAGIGQRMGGSQRKQTLLLCDIPILHHTLGALSECELIDGIVLMTHPQDLECLQNDIQIRVKFPKLLAILSGESQRQDTVYKGLEYLHMHSPHPQWVVVHDGVRPFVSQECLRNTIQAAFRWDAAIAAVPVIDTIKQVDASSSWIHQTPDRNSYWAAQTPQAFSFPLLWQAYQAGRTAEFSATDDASMVERMGRQVRLVRGDYENIKITNPLDLIVGEHILAERGGRWY